MYLLDDRYSTAVAFVTGYDTALDGVPLSGFQRYVAARIVGRESSVHWSYLLASTKVPTMLAGRTGIDQIPREVEGELTDALVDLLESYQQESSPTNDNDDDLPR